MTAKPSYEELERRIQELEKKADTGRNKIEKELQKSEARHSKMVANIGDVIVIIDQAGINKYKSPNIEKLFGWKPDEVVGASTWDNVHPDDIESTQQFFEKIMHTPDAVGTMECRYRCRDGSYKWIEFTGTNLFHDPDIQGLLGNYQDITERKRAEEEVARSTALLRDVVDMVPAYICAKNSEGRFLLVNRKLADFYGIPVDSLTGMLHADLCEDEEELRAMLAADRQVIESGRAEVIPEETMKKPDGSIAVLETFKIPFTADSKPAVLIAAADITERKRAEDALRESEDLLFRAQEIAHTGSWKLDLTSNRLTWSDEVYRIFGCKPQEFAVTYEVFLDFVHPDDRAALDEAYSRSMREGADGYEIEHRIVRRGSGEVRHVHERCVHERDDAGDIVQSTGMVQDITDRKQAEEHLSLLGRMLDGAPASITIYDTDGRFVFANEETVSLHGYESMDEFMEINLHDLDVPESEALLAERFRKIAEEGAARFEVEHYRKDGSTFPLEVLAKRIEWEGRPAILSIAADITERKQAEAEREKLQAQLTQAQKMESVGRLAGGVAHDFNNMLSVILGNTEMAMENMAPADPLYNNLSEISSAARRSADITRQLLAFARKQTIAPKVLDLNRTIKSMLKMLRRLIGEDIDLAWLPETKIWPVRMDPSQIDQILANLCINARDAIADIGKITIETGTVTFDSAYCAEHPGFVAGDFVLLAVSDDGCGMDQGTQANLFEPFFTTKELGKGTGLGLATVYGIVKQNGGFINVYSEPDQGTTFRIYLPRYLAETESPEKKTSDKINRGGTETILLVEDEPSILRMTRMMLERMGYKVLAAGTPGEAIALAREHAGEIHLLMTDVVMPEMNGRDLARNLLSLYPNLKRLFMSGYTANVIAHHGVLDEGVQFIQKPFAKQDLASKVRELLDEDNL